MLNWGFTSFKSMTLTWKVLPFPLQDRSSWPRLVSSAQRLLVLGWAVGVGGAQSPEIVHTEREDKVNAETERDRMCYERKKEKEKRKHLQMSSIMSINIFWTLDNEYSPFSSKIFELFGDLSCSKPNVFALLSMWWQNEVRIKVCMWVRCTYCATGNIATRLLLRLFTITVDYHPLEVKL